MAKSRNRPAFPPSKRAHGSGPSLVSKVGALSFFDALDVSLQRLGLPAERLRANSAFAHFGKTRGDVPRMSPGPAYLSRAQRSALKRAGVNLNDPDAVAQCLAALEPSVASEEMIPMSPEELRSARVRALAQFGLELRALLEEPMFTSLPRLEHLRERALLRVSAGILSMDFKKALRLDPLFAPRFMSSFTIPKAPMLEKEMAPEAEEEKKKPEMRRRLVLPFPTLTPPFSRWPREEE